MAAGSIQTVLNCIPSAYSWQTQAPCPSGYSVSVTQAYLLDPSQQPLYESLSSPFDYAYAAGIWGLAFSTVVGLYFVSHGIALVLGMIRRG